MTVSIVNRIMLACSNNNIFLHNVLFNLAIISCSILQCHYKRMFPKQLAICFQRIFRIRRLDKHNYKICIFLVLTR